MKKVIVSFSQQREPIIVGFKATNVKDNKIYVIDKNKIVCVNK